MAVKPLGKNIIFTFVDKVNSKGQFEGAQSSGGIQLVGGHEDSASKPRWAIAVAVGPDVKHVKAGTSFLIPPLRWTNSIKHDDHHFWKTDEAEVAAYRRKDTSEIVAINDFIIFNPLPRKAVTSQYIIVNTVDHDMLAEGILVSTGDKAEAGMEAGVTIYFNDANFRDFFADGTNRRAFIREAEVIAYSLPE